MRLYGVVLGCYISESVRLESDWHFPRHKKSLEIDGLKERVAHYVPRLMSAS